MLQPTILNDLGWTATKAQLYSVPPYVCACLVAIAVAFASDKTNRRGIYLAVFTIPAIAGFAILRWVTDPNVRYGGIFLITIGAFPGGPGFLAWATNNAGNPSVRAVSTAYVVTLGTAGGILSTWTYVAKDAPKYPTGHTINLAGQCCVLILAVAGICYSKWENKQRDLGRRDHRLNGLNEEQVRDLGYRYVSRFLMYVLAANDLQAPGVPLHSLSNIDLSGEDLCLNGYFLYLTAFPLTQLMDMNRIFSTHSTVSA